jgi:hypothetical protein
MQCSVNASSLMTPHYTSANMHLSTALITAVFVSPYLLAISVVKVFTFLP